MSADQRASATEAVEARLTPVQQRLLAEIRKQGRVYGPGNGYSIATVRALAQAGLVTYTTQSVDRHNYRSQRTHYLRDWWVEERTEGAPVHIKAEKIRVWG